MAAYGSKIQTHGAGTVSQNSSYGLVVTIGALASPEAAVYVRTSAVLLT